MLCLLRKRGVVRWVQQVHFKMKKNEIRCRGAPAATVTVGILKCGKMVGRMDNEQGQEMQTGGSGSA